MRRDGLADALCAGLGREQHDGRDAVPAGTGSSRARAGCVPEIFNTDQGSQFTSQEWTSKLAGWGVQISMDGRGRWMDNVFIERLWRSIKYEDIYLREYATVVGLEQGVEHWMKHYNTWRPHQEFGNRTPAEVYRPKPESQTKTKEIKQAA